MLKIVCLLLLIFFVSGCAGSGELKEFSHPDSSSSKTYVYLVLPFNLIDIYDHENYSEFRTNIWDAFNAKLVENGYSIIDVYVSDSTLSFTSKDQIGKLLNADIVIFGTIRDVSMGTKGLSEKLFIKINALDLKTNKLIWESRYEITVNLSLYAKDRARFLADSYIRRLNIMGY